MSLDVGDVVEMEGIMFEVLSVDTVTLEDGSTLSRVNYSPVVI